MPDTAATSAATSAANPAAAPLRIDIVSDVVCPWCVVGYRQLLRALKDTGTPHEIHWHPFELNPDMPDEGQDLAEHISEKYGSTPEQSRENRQMLTELGAGLGIAFNYGDGMRMYNTFNVHQLIHWAKTQDKADALERAFFTAYFTDRKDLSDTQVLTEIAASVGLDADEARAVLADQRYAQAVREAEQTWLRQGIRGVPSMVFRNKHLVTGAQGVENYTSILNQLAQMQD